MNTIKLIEPTYLYTLLNQYLFYSNLSNPRYLLLLDARPKGDYNECHIIMAKRIKKNDKNEFVVPYDSELECQENIVVYDGNTDTINTDTQANQCANILNINGARNGVLILKGGYEYFSRLYPFLRTQKIIWMPRELDAYHPFPLEIIPQFLYLGNSRHACDKVVQKQLKIKCHVNCTTEPSEIFPKEDPNIFEVKVTDEPESNIGVYLGAVCTFIEKNRKENKCVLVYSNLGISRAPIIILAYLMHSRNINIENAWNYLSQISTVMRPNRGFIKQLSVFEKSIFNSKPTNTNDPYY